jgi:hypothetical protein
MNSAKFRSTFLQLLQVDAVTPTPNIFLHFVVAVTNTFATRMIPTEPLALRDFTRVHTTRRQDPTDMPLSPHLTALFSTAMLPTMREASSRKTRSMDTA